MSMKKIIFFFILFFTFNTLEIESNSDKYLIYDKNDIYDTSSFKVFFYNANSEELDKFIKENNIIVKYYIVDDKKYYVKSIDKLVLLYTSEMNSNNKIYYLYNGINIDGICINTSVEKLMLLEKKFKIY
jgi:hypothetical protein